MLWTVANVEVSSVIFYYTIMECSKCLLNIINDNISCSGFCNGTFHYNCAEIDRVSFNKCAKFPNVMWFCDDCRLLLENKSFRKLIIGSQDFLVQQTMLSKLVDDVACNSKLLHNVLMKLTATCTVEEVDTPVSPGAVFLVNDLPDYTNSTNSTFAAIVSSSVTTASVSTTLASTSSSREFSTAFSSSTTVTASPIKHSHPIILSPVMSETDVASIGAAPINADSLPCGRSHILSSNDDAAAIRPQPKFLKPICGTNPFPTNLRIKTVAPRFWIHLSRFDPSTSEDDILSMANMCLESNNCIVRKLIPKNRELNDLGYICFKLGINDELREKALISDTWPAGVFIRPFQSNFRKSGPPRVKFRTTPLMVNTTSV